MSKISQKAIEFGADSGRPVRSGGWLAGAVRALGFSTTTETGGGGRGFDFGAMHRSLSTLEQKLPTAE